MRHVQALKVDRTRDLNRRHSGVTSPEVIASIDAHLAFLDQQIEALEQRIHDHIDQDPGPKADKDLLLTIPGIGETTAAVFLAEVPDVSLNTQGKLIKWGNAHIRAAFFMPALSAHNHNPIVAALRERLLQRGKSKMTVIVAVMRKLVHLCYGVLKTRKPFDPNHPQTAAV